LFGTGILSLLEQQGEDVVIERAPTLQEALGRDRPLPPDVIVYFKEKSVPLEQTLLQKLGARYGARVIHCTLEADHLTIYDQTQINHATVDDLMAAVLKA
jgi:hypothetical protein